MPVKHVAFISDAAPFDGGAHTFESNFAEILAHISEKFDIVPIYIRTNFKSQTGKFQRSTNQDEIYFKINTYTKFLIACQTSVLLSGLLARFKFLRNPFEKFLASKGVQVAVFLSPNPLALIVHSIPIVTTVWDLGHRDLPSFPEYNSKNNFREREFYFQNTLPRSSMVLVDSDVTKTNIECCYGVQSSKIQIIGLLPKRPVLEISPKTDLDKESYIFYPAQFWHHKNHLRLIEAFKIVLLEQPKIKLLLSGSDKGALFEIMAQVQKMELSEKVIYVGFVSKSEYWKLLYNCECLVFPSLIGPTNLPPLEALMLGKRMAISEFHRESMQELTTDIFYFDPVSVESMARVITQAISGSDFKPISFEEQNVASISSFLEEINRVF